MLERRANTDFLCVLVYVLICRVCRTVTVLRCALIEKSLKLNPHQVTKGSCAVLRQLQEDSESAQQDWASEGELVEWMQVPSVYRVLSVCSVYSGALSIQGALSMLSIQGALSMLCV